MRFLLTLIKPYNLCGFQHGSPNPLHGDLANEKLPAQVGGSLNGLFAHMQNRPVIRRIHLYWRTSRLFLGLVCLLTQPVPGWAADSPQTLRQDSREAAKIRLSESVLKKVYLAQDGRGSAITSTDNGDTWTSPERPVDHWAAKALVDRDGELHGFFTIHRQIASGNRLAIDRFIDVWHAKTTGSGEEWQKPQMIHEGWIGAITGQPMQLASGRIVIPSQHWMPGASSAPPIGSNYTLTLYSDDGGGTWQKSASKVTAPAPANFNGSNYGAIEAGFVALEPDRLWMLMRSQTGFLYESFSNDGSNWTEAGPSRFYASTGPPFLIDMLNGRIVLFWNNCEMPPRANGAGVYGGRDALHAAISEDYGQTWHGFREVYLDSQRHNTPPRAGDRGTAYPYAVPTSDGRRIEMTSGQGNGRRVVKLIDPDWLLERKRRDDFSNGIEHWSVFKGFGPASGWWQDRVPGATILPHPDKSGTNVLHVRRPDEKPADGAVWNFPSAHGGSLRLRLMLQSGSEGLAISLNDRFFEPTDYRAQDRAVFTLRIDSKGRLPGGYHLPLDEWVDVELKWYPSAWDDSPGRCRVFRDGEAVAELARLSPTINGISYLHLRSLAEKVDNAGTLVDWVEAEIQ